MVALSHQASVRAGEADPSLQSCYLRFKNELDCKVRAAPGFCRVKINNHSRINCLRNGYNEAYNTSLFLVFSQNKNV